MGGDFDARSGHAAFVMPYGAVPPDVVNSPTLASPVRAPRSPATARQEDNGAAGESATLGDHTESKLPEPLPAPMIHTVSAAKLGSFGLVSPSREFLAASGSGRTVEVVTWTAESLPDHWEGDVIVVIGGMTADGKRDPGAYTLRLNPYLAWAGDAPVVRASNR